MALCFLVQVAVHSDATLTLHNHAGLAMWVVYRAHHCTEDPAALGVALTVSSHRYYIHMATLTSVATHKQTQQ